MHFLYANKCNYIGEITFSAFIIYVLSIIGNDYTLIWPFYWFFKYKFVDLKFYILCYVEDFFHIISKFFFFD